MLRSSYKPDKTQFVTYQYRGHIIAICMIESLQFHNMHVDDSCCMIVYPVPMICVSPFWQSDDPLKVCSALKG
jgi:hypothetical protein